MRINHFHPHSPTFLPSYAVYENPKTGLKTISVRPRPLLTITALVVSDLIILIFSNLFAHLIRFGLEKSISSHAILQLWPVLGLFLLGYFFASAYSLIGTNPIEELRKLTTVTTAVYLIVIMALFLVKQTDNQSRLTFLMAWLFSAVFLPMSRALIKHMFASQAWWGTPVFVLGAGKTAEVLISKLHSQPGLGLKPIACFDDDKDKKASKIYGIPVIGQLSEAPELAKTLKVNHAIVAMPGVVPTDLTKIVRLYAHSFPHLFFVPNLFGITSLHVNVQDISGIMSLHARQNLLIYSNRLLKRFLDILLLIPIALIAFPVITLAALATLIANPGNPFYAQEREGYRGKRIRVWKLRTMCKDGDKVLAKHFEKHPEAKQEWETYFKLTKDPRIIPGIGHLLRKTSLDELPQLWNIARGDMSFVGPRPFPFYHLESFDESFRDLRRSVVPGLTGLWQVSARSEGNLKIQEELDSYYIRNWSIWMDIYIIARTPWAVLFGKGAY